MCRLTTSEKRVCQICTNSCTVMTDLWWTYDGRGSTLVSFCLDSAAVILNEGFARWDRVLGTVNRKSFQELQSYQTLLYPGLGVLAETSSAAGTDARTLPLRWSSSMTAEV